LSDEETTLAVSSLLAATVTIDEQKPYQTVEGFGAHGAMNVWWSGGPFYNTNWLTLVIDDLGLTMTRNEYYPPEDNNWNKQTDFLQTMKNKAQASGEPLNFIATFWTPPGYMKDNNATTGGGHLKADMRDDLGNYAVEAITRYKNIGIDLYALSLQNESAYEEPYNSCVYTNNEYRDMLKVAGPIVHNAFPNVKLFGAEHMLINFGYFEGTIALDPLAIQHLDVVASHGYSDGVNPTPTSTAAGYWKRVADFCAGKNGSSWSTMGGKKMPAWMTETSGYFDNWNDAFRLAQDIYTALKYGKASARVGLLAAQRVGRQRICHHERRSDRTPFLRFQDVLPLHPSRGGHDRRGQRQRSASYRCVQRQGRRQAGGRPAQLLDFRDRRDDKRLRHSGADAQVRLRQRDFQRWRKYRRFRQRLCSGQKPGDACRNRIQPDRDDKTILRHGQPFVCRRQ